jgi:hypothetical protein
MPSLRHKRGTLAQINAAATANALRQGEIYLVTDQNRLTVGTAVNAHEPLAKQSEAGGGADSRAPRLLTDFTHINAVQDDFIEGTIGTGASFTGGIPSALSGPNHPGIHLWRSGTTANSGVQCVTSVDRFRIGGGEQWDVNFATPAAFTGTTFRTGAFDTASATAPVDGVHFEFSGSGAIVGKCRSNNIESVSPTIAALAATTWYHGRITVNAAANAVTFEIFSDAGVSLGSQTVATNIPTAAGREIGWGGIATNSGTVATDLVYVDRFLLTNPGRIVARGAA